MCPRCKYIPDAVVYNKGPENIKDFLVQRRRIYAGHIHIEKTEGYRASSMMPKKIIELIYFTLKDAKPSFKEIVWFFGAILLELCGRLLGMYDFYIKKKNPYVWDIAKTTKELS